MHIKNTVLLTAAIMGGCYAKAQINYQFLRQSTESAFIGPQKINVAKIKPQTLMRTKTQLFSNSLTISSAL